MIRHGLISDIPVIMEMAEEFYNTTDYSKFARFDFDTVLALTELIILHNICIVATDDNDKAVGVLGLWLCPFMFNRNVLTCEEVIWWVKTEFRKSSYGIQMIQYADDIRKLRGAVNFRMALLSTSPAGLESVYESLGFNFSEKYFTKVN